MMLYKVIIVVCFASAVLSAEIRTRGELREVVPVENTQVATTSTGLTWNKYTITATALAAVFIISGISAITSLLLPFLAYKLCYLMGSCNYDLDAYVDDFIAPDAAADPIATEDHHRNRRSTTIDYVGPLIQTLAAAYEKYGEENEQRSSDPAKKKFRMLNYFVR